MELEYNKEDLFDIGYLLAVEKSEGSIWVAYLLGEPIGMDHLAFFERLYDVMEYCHEMSTDLDYYSYLPIVQLQKEVAEQLSLYQKQTNNEENLVIKKSKKMNQKSIERVLEQVKFTGFGDALETKLRERMLSGEKNIAESYKPDFQIPVEAVANLQLSDKGNYFFNSYDILVNKENAVPLKQSLYINGPQQTNDGTWVNSNITLKEAANMMDLNDKGQGRSVLKKYVNASGEEYKAWTRFDFTQVDKYGNFPTVKRPEFDLEKKLADFGYSAVTKEQLESLYKGNPTTLSAHINGHEVKQAVVVNADFKTITNYGKPQGLEKAEAKDQAISKEQNINADQAVDKSAKQSRSRQHKTGTDEQGAPPQQQKKERKSRSIKH